jgi:hypothetical protein
MPNAVRLTTVHMLKPLSGGDATLALGAWNSAAASPTISCPVAGVGLRGQCVRHVKARSTGRSKVTGMGRVAAIVIGEPRRRQSGQATSYSGRTGSTRPSQRRGRGPSGPINSSELGRRPCRQQESRPPSELSQPGEADLRAKAGSKDGLPPSIIFPSQSAIHRRGRRKESGRSFYLPAAFCHPPLSYGN